MAGRQAAQTAAIISLLAALPEEQLEQVIGALEVKGLVTREKAATRSRARCGVCGEVYPVCRRKWADDHPFENTSKDPV